MKVLFTNGLFCMEQGFVVGDMLVEDGIICNVGKQLGGDGAVVHDMEGKQVVPGFIDIHTHGAMGVDVNAATAKDYEIISRFFAGMGTTAWLASILTDTREQTLWCIEEYKKWKQMEHQGARLIGLHLEGPFLAAAYKGAMPEHLLQKGNMGLIREYQQAAEGGIRYITISPEVEGCLEMIPELKQMGIQVAMGHSGADYDCTNQAIKLGARAATHTGNAMKLLHQHQPAIFGAVLEADEVYCELICDDLHLHPGTVRLIMKTKGIHRVVAVSDSIMATGLPDGNYRLGVNEVVVADGDAQLASGGGRAGSTLTTGKALKNILRYTQKTLVEILPVLTKNPAALIGVNERMGTLEPGKEANFVVLDEENNVIATWVKGKLV